MTLANFSRFGKVPSENEKLMNLSRGFERTEHESLSILDGIFLKLGFTPCKTEQPLQGMELQEKEAQKD